MIGVTNYLKSTPQGDTLICYYNQEKNLWLLGLGVYFPTGETITVILLNGQNVKLFSGYLFMFMLVMLMVMTN